MRLPPPASADFPGPNSTYGERLLWALAARGLNQSDLARMVGVTPQSIQYLCDPANHARGSRNTPAFADACGVDATWLARGTGTPTPATATSTSTEGVPQGVEPALSPAPAATHKVPVLSFAQVSLVHARGGAQAAEIYDGYISTDRELSAQSFALEIRDDSMVAPPNTGEESFHEGDRIIVDCSVAPLPGDFIVASDGSSEAIFRKYRPRGVDESGHEVFELVPLNPDYPVLRSDRQEARVIGVMVELRRYRKKK